VISFAAAADIFTKREGSVDGFQPGRCREKRAASSSLNYDGNREFLLSYRNSLEKFTKIQQNAFR